MRNSAGKHNQVMLPRLTALVFACMLRPCPAGDEVFGISSEDMVAIHADRAWEDIQPDTAHFAGHFDMRVRDLQLTATRATLYGPLNNPDRLDLKGSPARLSLSHTEGGRVETIKAEAREIVYDRASASMRLNGAARLAQNDNVLLSDSIEYDIKNDRFHTTGKGGVQIKVRPQP